MTSAGCESEGKKIWGFPGLALLNLRAKADCLIAVLVLCPLMFGQASERYRAQGDTQANRTADVSDLAKDNLDRVAASSIQIREVLVKDAGLLVELKRWIAKEATDNGQVVADSNLSDQSIF